MKLHISNSCVTNLLLLIVTLVLGCFVFGANVLNAQTPPVGIPSPIVELDGYMWSSTIGWISMNCRTGGITGGSVCGTSNYKVVIENNGDLKGYAWSSNVGWIKFSRTYLSDFPVAAGNVQETANVTGNYNGLLTMRGWARACAGTTSGSCSNMISRTDGWDGWISFAGTSPNYGVTMSNAPSIGGAVPGSYGWGSTVVGWLNLDLVKYLDLNYQLTGVGCTIAIGAGTCNTPISWSIISATSPDVRNVTTNTTYSTNASGTNVSVPIRFGANTIVARDGATTLQTMVLTASCAGGIYSATTSTCVLPPVTAPTISITANREIVRSGTTVTVTWSISPSPLAAGTCTIYGPGMPGLVTTGATIVSTALKAKTKFVMSCSGAYGTVDASDTVDVIPSMQEV